jgi:hypothetical protein
MARRSMGDLRCHATVAEFGFLQNLLLTIRQLLCWIFQLTLR